VAAAYFHEELSSANGKLPKITIVASHEGQVSRATHFRNVIQRLSGDQVELAVLTKQKVRPGDKRVFKSKLIGNVQGRVCIIVDDIVNTGSTLVNNIEGLKEAGATSIYAWATHGVFGSPSADDAPSRLQKLDALEYLLVSNSIMSQARELPPKIKLLNVAPLLAEAIVRSLQGESVSEILTLDSEHSVERYDG